MSMPSKANTKKITPFGISPNPNSLFLTPLIEAVLFRVRFTVNNRQGVTLILGDVGLGKSSVVRYLHAEFDAMDDTISLFIPRPAFKTDYSFLQTLCAGLGLPPKRSLLAQMNELERYLATQYQEGFNVVVFLDEAQKLTSSMLEVVRDLLNFETSEVKLLQIVLSGQLELRERLLSAAQKPLYSRLMAPSVLLPLSLEETAGMIERRCQLAKIKNPFPTESIERIFLLSVGVPRSALRLCAISYEMTKLAKLQDVPAELIETAFDEMKLELTEDE
jgi:general secretion pathway protein A